MPKVHNLMALSHHDAYDETQMRSDIRDGDVIQLRDGAVAVLVQAWPILAKGESDVFDGLAPGFTLEALDGGKYAISAIIASKA